MTGYYRRQLLLKSLDKTTLATHHSMP